MLDAWRRAGIAEGHVVIDVGAGPGYASVDLAEVVGPSGRVIALERSRRFLDALADQAGSLGLGNIEAREQDVCDDAFGEALADAAWCRWVLSFVADPARTIGHIARALRPGGVAVFHEYADYGAWQMMPPSPEVDRFRSLVMQSWRDAGGEPNIGLHVPGWIEAEGMEIVEVRPLIEIVGRGDDLWRWPAAFIATNAKRLAELGYVDSEEAGRLALALDNAAPGSRMVTPLVVEITARRI
jgi:SAM-dependent methyltransferase